MRERLLEAYQERHEDFKNVRYQFADEEMAGPFLMAPNNLYAEQPNPLLIVGQETNGWGYDVEDLERQMDAYEEFNVGINYYASPFWNVVRQTERALGNVPHSCAWTNIANMILIVAGLMESMQLPYQSWTIYWLRR